ncbi:MAG TPA: FtsX-like permease family protein [Symbiobacteriaceae bacterium]|jgi:putative ABC transport system permease protein|nr:FtsX-like permease family protein [Symbiobacteriaceae bacterium]
MWPLIRIALRNVWAQKRRNSLIGLAVMVSALLLLLSDAVMNGVTRQVLRGYLNLQSGHVAVVWSEMKTVKPNDAARFLTKLKSFDPAQAEANRQATQRLKQYLADSSSNVAAFFPAVRRSVQTKVGDQINRSIAYGLTKANRDHLLNTGTIRMVSGRLPEGSSHAVALSQESATAQGLTIGSQIILETAVGDEWKSVTFEVTGIYANGAGYDNYYAFMDDGVARDLFGYGPDEFDAGQIFLKDQSRAERFAHDLDAYLLAGGTVLRAESYAEASPFYTNNSRLMKMMFNGNVVFLLIIIAVGLRATIGINLMQRMREFGTIRAIGFGRCQNYIMILAEVWFLAMAALLVAFVLAAGLTWWFGSRGVWVGPGAISFALGGESFYPELSAWDVVKALGIILGFAVFATLGPGLRIVGHGITDLLLARQRRVSLVRMLLRGARGA